jgi:hypothetical protein
LVVVYFLRLLHKTFVSSQRKFAQATKEKVAMSVAMDDTSIQNFGLATSVFHPVSRWCCRISDLALAELGNSRKGRRQLQQIVDMFRKPKESLS